MTFARAHICQLQSLMGRLGPAGTFRVMGVVPAAADAIAACQMYTDPCTFLVEVHRSVYIGGRSASRGDLARQTVATRASVIKAQVG